MKVLYLETKRKLSDYNINSINLGGLPKELFIAYSIQYKTLADQIKQTLEQNKTKIKGFTQVLGCTKLKSEYPILLIGSGRFHALNLALQNKEVFVLDNGQIKKISEVDTALLKSQKMANLNRFYHAEKIGFLVSTKPGQNNLKQAKALLPKLTLRYPAKEFYFFVSNNINLAEIENFPIDLWINTACQGLINDSHKIINLDDIYPVLA